MIFIVVRNTVRAEPADAWPSAVETFTASTRAETGNLFFQWSRSLDDPGVYVLLEAWRDAAAHALHVSSEHFAAALGVMSRMLAGPPEVLRAELAGDAWSVSDRVRVHDAEPPSTS